MRLSTLYAFTCCLLLAAPAGAQKPNKPPKEPAASVGKSQPAPATNACGCYEDSNGLCHCTKKSRCGCPGACEPNGCEEKRQKELEKEAQEELKRQREEDKKRNAELAKKQDDEEKKEAAKRQRSLRGLRLVDPQPQ
jgi:hypothetical protein